MRNGANANIYKLKISGSTAYYQTGSYTAERMIITGAGSCETLDMYNYNGKVYFLVGGNSSNATYDWYPNTQVARVEFKAGTTKYSDHKRISYMNYAASYYDNDDKKVVSKKDGTTRRVAGAVCGEKTILRVEMVPDSGSAVVRFAVYDTQKLNKALDSSSLTDGLKLNSTAATQAKIQSHLMTLSSSGDLVHPNTSFKGIELSSYRSVYIAGGGSDAAHPQIARVDMEGGSNNWVYDYLINITNISNTEIYGLQADRGNIYFHTVGSNNTTGQAIWYFPEDVVGYSCRKVGETENKAHEIRYKEASESPWGCTSAWTCTSAGFTPYVFCISCGYSQSTQEYYSSARGHQTEVLPAVEATCTTPGTKAGSYCSRCSLIQPPEPDSAPFGHKYDNVILTQEATCTQKGIITYTCVNCSDTYTEELEKLLHIDDDSDGICDVCGGSTDAEPQNILVDYAKTVETNVIEKAIINGISEEHLREAVLESVTDTDFGTVELFDADGDDRTDSVRFTPTKILSQVITLNCTVRFSDKNGTSQTRIIPLNIVPATIVYYETDFSDDVFTLTDTNDGWSNVGDSRLNEQESGDCENPVGELPYSMQEIPSNAFFADFNGESERYTRDYIYSGRNYDTASTWCYNADRTLEPVIDTALGTMTITRTANDPQKNDAFFYFQTGSTNNSLGSGFDLNYHPEDNHYAVIRLKLSNLQLSDGASAPGIDIQYYTASDRTETANDNQDYIRSAIVNEYGEPEAYALPAQSLSEEYVTVKIPLTFDESYDRRKVTALRFSINNVLSISDSQLGSVTIDYIYVGPLSEENSEPTIDHEYYENPTYAPTEYLLFDFDNSPNARARYNNSNYQNRTNFDTAAHWCYLADNTGVYENYTRAGTNGTVDNVKGTLTVAVVRQQSSHGRYGTYVGPTNGTNQVVNLSLENGDNYCYQSLNFTPTSGSKTYFHVRFKFRNCKQDQLLDIDGKTYLQLSLLNGTSTYHLETGTGFAFENDKYFELSSDITSMITSCGTVKSFYLRFCNIRGNSTGYVDIDYIYFGPESDPNKIRSAKEENVMIDFDNGDYDKNRYAGELYGGVNYDDASAWTNNTWFTHSISNGIMTLTPTQEEIDKEDGWGQKNMNSDFASLSYKMTGEDYIVARIKTNGVTPLSAENEPFFACYIGAGPNSGTWDTILYKESEPIKMDVINDDGKWVTYVIDISEYANQFDTLTFIRPYFMYLNYTSSSSIQIEYFYVGSLKNGSAPAESLYFGFGNRLEDQERYDSITYSGVNYDASNYQFGGLATSVTMNNKEGNLLVTADSGTDTSVSVAPSVSYFFTDFDEKDTSLWGEIMGRMYAVKSGGVVSGTVTGSDPYIIMTRPTCTYNYTIQSGDVVKMRIKSDTGIGKGAQLFFMTVSNLGSPGTENIQADNTTYTPNGTWQTITLTINSAAIGETVKGLRLDPIFEYSAKGNFQIDWVYIGPDFEGERTLSHSTSNYDLALNYHPEKAEIAQIRFKMENFVLADGATEPYFEMQYRSGRSSSMESLSAISFPSRYLSNGEYITLTIDLSDELGKAFCQQAEITALQTFFGNLSGAGKLTIDYIYVGPGEANAVKDMIYGYDEGYCDPSELSDGSSWFVEGSGIPLLNCVRDENQRPVLDENGSIIYTDIDYEGATDYTEASFTFVGTGFDIISRTNPDQGAIRVVVLDEEENIVQTLSVLNKTDSNDLYQIPVAKVVGLEHGEYTAKIFVNAAYDYGNDGNEDLFGGALDRGGQFYFDAIRIYNAIDTSKTDPESALAYSVYQSHGEADAVYDEIRNKLITAENFNADSDVFEGIVYLDASSADGITFEDAIAEYKAIGPNNEVYLANTNAIAFKLEVTGDIPASIDIGAKSVGSTPTEMVIDVSTEGPTTSATAQPISIATSSDLYYSANITSWKTDTTNTKVSYVYITIYNTDLLLKVKPEIDKK